MTVHGLIIRVRWPRLVAKVKGQPIAYSKKCFIRTSPRRSRLDVLSRSSTNVQVRISIRMDLKLSKYGYGVWAPFPLSMDHNMERWTTFHLNKTSEKGLYPTQVEKNTQEFDKSGFLRHFSSDFEQF